MGFKLNITKKDIENAVGGNFDPVPAGVYGGTIVEAVIKDSKSSGNPMYALNIRISEGATGIGRKIRSWHVIQGPGAFSSTNLLKALDLPYIRKDMTEQELEEFEFPDADDLIGRELNIKVGVDSYKGLNQETGEEETRYRNNIAGTFPYDPDKFSELDEDEGGAADSGSLL